MGRKLDTFIGASAVAIATFLIVGLLGTTTERIIVKPDSHKLKYIYLLLTSVILIQILALYLWVWT